MASFNSVVLMGNLTRDPELRYTPGGQPVANFGMAMNRKWKDKNEQLQEERTFVNLTAWGKSAETIAKYLKKGAPLLVDGRLRWHEWQTPAGEKRSKLEVTVEGFQLLPRRDGGVTGAGTGFPPGEFLADAATAFEDAEGLSDPFDGPPQEGGMPSGRA